jgi:hypothetical protein
VKTTLEAVNPEKLIVPLDVIPVAPEMAPAFEISNVGVSRRLVNVPVSEIPVVIVPPEPSAINIPEVMLPAEFVI